MAKLGPLSDTSADAGERIIDDALSMMRNHLGMEIAYLSEFAGDQIVFRAFDATNLDGPLSKGSTWPAAESYCVRVLNGTLPQIIPDTSQNAVARELAVTDEIPIGAQLSVPIWRSDGSAFGMLCFISTQPKPELNTRDLGVVEIFSALVQREVQRRVDALAARTANRDQIENLISNRAFEIFAQPIKELRTEKIAGYEALCRFPDHSDMPADAVFDWAARFGLRPELESRVIAAALDRLTALPDGGYLSVNAAPTTVTMPDFGQLFDGHDRSRILLEMTEHQEVADYPALLERLAPLREAGLRIAVDDAGTGYSGLHQIVQLQPDVIKLDRALVAGIDTDQAKRAMCAAMVHYAGESGAVLLAEGVETAAEAAELLHLGVTHAQGFYLGRPLPLKTLNAA